MASNVLSVCSPGATASQQHYIGRQLALSLASNVDWVGCQHLLDAARQLVHHSCSVCSLWRLIQRLGFLQRARMSLFGCSKESCEGGKPQQQPTVLQAGSRADLEGQIIFEWICARDLVRQACAADHNPTPVLCRILDADTIPRKAG